MRMRLSVPLFTLLGLSLAGCIKEPTARSAPDGGFFGDPDGFFLDIIDDGGQRFGDGFDAGAPLETFLGAATVRAADPPPPLVGGTLLVTHDGQFAVAADPERDRITITNLVGTLAPVSIDLNAHDEPGRLAEDAVGHVHVALRRGGAIVTIDPVTHTQLARRSVCPAPRGLAYDAAADALYVACATGELVTLPTSSDTPTRSVFVEDDLRDVVLSGGQLYVSTFRHAEVLALDGAGAIVSRTRPTAVGASEEATTAWRMIAAPSGGVFVLHQQSSTDPVVISVPGGYGTSSGFGDCHTRTPIVLSALSAVTRGTADTTPATMPCQTLAIDVAVSPDGAAIVIASPGSAPRGIEQELQLFQTRFVTALDGSLGTSIARGATTSDPRTSASLTADQRVVAVAYAPDGGLITQWREPAGIWILSADDSDAFVPFGGASRTDTGHTLFHSDAGRGVACASCHPEGGDDGHVWTFDVSGRRRTQSIRGGVLATAPFHWDGEFSDFSSLSEEVLTHRMGGGELSVGRTDALAHWIDGIPLLPAAGVSDTAAVTRGEALFASAGCDGCHSGARFSDQTTRDVGTGGAFQVPSLRGVAARAPFMHDGCAPTLRDRFVDPSCGGAFHGSVSSLDSSAIDDLIAYLRTL